MRIIHETMIVLLVLIAVPVFAAIAIALRPLLIIAFIGALCFYKDPERHVAGS